MAGLENNFNQQEFDRASIGTDFWNDIDFGSFVRPSQKSDTTSILTGDAELLTLYGLAAPDDNPNNQRPGESILPSTGPAREGSGLSQRRAGENGPEPTKTPGREEAIKPMDGSGRVAEALLGRATAPVKEFQTKWNESMAAVGLDKPENKEVADVLNELRDQLSAGKLDAGKLQKLINQMNKATEGNGRTELYRKVDKFSDDLARNYGIEVNFNLDLENGSTAVKDVELSIPAKSGEVILSIPAEGKVSAYKMTASGDAALPLSHAIVMDALRNKITVGKKDR